MIGELDPELRLLVDTLDRERQAWIEGRFDPTEHGPMVQDPDMTIFGPFGGDAQATGADLHARQRRISALFDGGSGTLEVVRAIKSEDLVVLVLIERNQVVFKNREGSHSWVLRTTQVFRRDGARWLRLHRHADPLIERRSLDAVFPAG